MNPFNPDLGSGLRRTPETDAANLGASPVPTDSPRTVPPPPHIPPMPEVRPAGPFPPRGVPALAAVPPTRPNPAAVVERLEALLRAPVLRMTVSGGGLANPAEIGPENVALLDRGEVALILQLLRTTMNPVPR